MDRMCSRACPSSKESHLIWSELDIDWEGLTVSGTGKKEMKILGACSFLCMALLTASCVAAPNCSSFQGEWTNQIGSTLSVSSVNPQTGALAGTYQSPSGTAGQKFAVTGWVNNAPAQPNGDNASVISFSVQWGRYGTITSWTGSCKDEKGVPTIRTLWHLATPNSSFSWDHIVSNSDVFTPK